MVVEAFNSAKGDNPARSANNITGYLEVLLKKGHRNARGAVLKEDANVFVS